MKASILSALALASSVFADPGNLFSGKILFAHKFYADEVNAAVKNISDSTLAAKAAKVASIGTFYWIDVMAKVPTIGDFLAQVPSGSVMGLIVYDLPDRDCAALASNGELSIANDGLNKYKTQYIDPFRAQLLKYPDVSVVLIIEPDSLPNLVTNMDKSKCSGAKTAYMDGVAYALKQLNLPNVAMYIDAGHGGWLGWDANIDPGAKIFGQVYSNAGKPSQVRGLAVNTANWNAFSATTPEFSSPYNKATDELKYATLLAPKLKDAGFPAHFIMDTGRNGRQGLRAEWGDWCNVKGAGFGVRPTSSTGSDLFDAFVWAKPGGESDGTSDSSAARYDAHCGQSDSAQPAPEAGTWFQDYFVDLVRNANPTL
jgi:cellulose 1,4-beta-cellobiosidase